MRPDMVRSYLKDILESVTGERPEPDEDGDLPVRFRNACFFVRVVNPTDPVVQIFSVARAGLEQSPELALALNDINMGIQFARVFHVRDQVLVETEIWASDVNEANVDYACRTVAEATDDINSKLDGFPGHPQFQESKDPGYTPRADTISPYL